MYFELYRRTRARNVNRVTMRDDDQPRADHGRTHVPRPALATRPLSSADRKHSTISGGTIVRRWKYAVASWRNSPVVVDGDVIARDKRASAHARVHTITPYNITRA